MGRLALFVRFAGCNFNCLGFGVQKELENGQILTGCDTLRAVFVKEFKPTYLNLNANELLERVFALIKDKKPIVVITGGEPLLHHKDEEFIKFIKALQEANLSVHFESNGSIEIDFEKYPFYKNCVFALSVKLSNSGVSEDKRLNFKALQAFKENAKESFYKFVLDERNFQSSLAEIEQILSKCKMQVFCMPLGKNEKELRKNAPALANLCIKMGYNYSDRIHIRLWDDKEGV